MTAPVDAPEEAPILAALQRRGWRLTHILITHHHGDHTAANLALKQRFDLTIIGPAGEAARIPGIDKTVADGDRLDMGGHRVEVIATPGHTAGHVCYHLPEDGMLLGRYAVCKLGHGQPVRGNG